MKKIIYLFLILFIFVGCSLNVAEGNSYDTSEQKANIELCGLSNDVAFYVNFPVNGNEIVRYKCYCDAKDGSFRFWDKSSPNSKIKKGDLKKHKSTSCGGKFLYYDDGTLLLRFNVTYDDTFGIDYVRVTCDDILKEFLNQFSTFNPMGTDFDSLSFCDNGIGTGKLLTQIEYDIDYLHIQCEEASNGYYITAKRRPNDIKKIVVTYSSEKNNMNKAVFTAESFEENNIDILLPYVFPNRPGVITIEAKHSISEELLELKKINVLGSKISNQNEYRDMAIRFDNKTSEEKFEISFNGKPELLKLGNIASISITNQVQKDIFKDTPDDFSKYIDTIDDCMLVIPYNDCGWCLDEAESKSQMTDCCIKLILNRSETAIKTPAEYGSYELYYSTRVQ